MNWNWDQFWMVLALLIGLMVVLSIITGSIASAVVKVKKTGAYRVELNAPELSGYGGKIHVAVDSEAELIKFLQRWNSDIIRWSESPDRVKR